MSTDVVNGVSDAILFVDDNIHSMEVYVEDARRSGAEVLLAPGPDEALFLAGENASRIRVVILDIIMPAGLLRNLETNQSNRTGVVLYRELKRICPDSQYLVLTQIADEVKSEFKGHANVKVIRKSRIGSGRGRRSLEREIREIMDPAVAVLRDKTATLRSLGANWDSYGAPRINPEILDAVDRDLAEFVVGSAFPLFVVPTHAGTVQLEFHIGEDDLEVGVMTETSIRAWHFHKGALKEVIEGPLMETRTRLIEILRRIEARHGKL
jgi:CheY-like chemotaxis protein